MGDEHVEVSAGEFDGRFHRFERKLGRGATKKVYLAYDTERGVDCAWNQISLHSLTQEEQEGLEKEINVMKSLDHENILKYHAHWTTPNFLCFITDYQTHSLKNYINERKIRLSTVKNWSRQILSGLAHLHERQILHRDIKCDNLFLNSQNSTVVIGDLGLAKEMTKATGANGEPMSIVGTPQFMAPEQLHLQTHYDEKVDIYALGMCIIEMMTRTYPYAECRTILEVITCINEDRDCQALTRIKSQNSHSFIQWCCHRNPECRPSALEAIEHSWLCRTTAEDNKYCSDLVAPDETEKPATSKPVPNVPKPSANDEHTQPGPANADAPLKPKQIRTVRTFIRHDAVEPMPVEDSPRTSFQEESYDSSPDARPTINTVNQPTAHSANLNPTIASSAPNGLGVSTPNPQVGNQQFPANSQPNHNAFSQYVQPGFVQPQMGMNFPMAMPNFNPMMYMQMNPGMNMGGVPPQMMQQFFQMAQANAPNMDPRMVETMFQQLIQQYTQAQQAAQNYMTQQWVQQQFANFMQQQGLPTQNLPQPNGTAVPQNGTAVPQMGVSQNGTAVPQMAVPQNGTAVPQMAVPQNGTSVPQMAVPQSGGTVPPTIHQSTQPTGTNVTPNQKPPIQPSTNLAPNEPRLSASAKSVPNPIEAPVSLGTSQSQQQFTPNATLEGPPAGFSQPGSTSTTPQPSFNQSSTQAFPNTYSTSGNYATPQTTPTQFKQAPSSNNQQQYQPAQNANSQYTSPNPAQAQPQFTSSTQSQSSQQFTTATQSQTAPQFATPPQNQQQFQPSSSAPPNPQFAQPSNSAPPTPQFAQPSNFQQQYQTLNPPQTQPTYPPQAQFQNANPTPQFTSGPYRPAPDVPRNSFQSGPFSANATSLSASAQSSASHSPSNSPHVMAPSLNPAKARQISTVSDTSTASTRKTDSKRKCEFSDSRNISLVDPVKVASIELTEDGSLYYVLRIWIPTLGKGKKFGVTVQESDDVNKIIQQLLEDKKLPLEWHERVAFALQMAKDNLQQPRMSNSLSEPSLQKREHIPFGDTSRQGSTQNLDNSPPIDTSDIPINPITPIEAFQTPPDALNEPFAHLQHRPQVKRQRSRDSAEACSPPRGIPTLRRHNSAPVTDNISDPDPTHMSQIFSHANYESQSDAIQTNQPASVHSNVATPERSKAPSQMPIEKPPSPPEAINLVVTSNEESKADPTRSTPQRSVNPSRPDVNTTLDDDRPSPTKPPSNIPFAAFPPEQDKLYKRIIYMSSEELLEFCEVHAITNEGIPITPDIELNVVQMKILHHILAERGEKRKPVIRRKPKKKEKENEKPKTKRILSAPPTKEESQVLPIRRSSEPVLNSLTKSRPVPTIHDSKSDAALNPNPSRLCDNSDEDTTLAAELAQDILLEETNKKDETESLAQSILELHKFMQMSDSQGNSQEMKRMMLANLEKLKNLDVAKYEELTTEFNFSNVISREPPTSSEPPPPERITRPCTTIDPNSSDADSFFIAMAHSLQQLGQEVTALEIRQNYCRELQTIINEDDASAENLSRQYQKVRGRILRMYGDNAEQALSVLEKFSQPGFWHQHLFDNTKSVMSILWGIRIRLYMDGFDEDQIMDIGKKGDTDLKIIEIFQERIYEDGVPAFVYRIVEPEAPRQSNTLRESEPFLQEIVNDLLSKEETRTRENAKPVSSKPVDVVRQKSGSSNSEEARVRAESPKKSAPIEPFVSDDPSDPFQKIVSPAFIKSADPPSTSLIPSSTTIRRLDSNRDSTDTASAKDDSPRESPSKSEPLDPADIPKEKSKPKLTEKEKEQRKLERARKRAEIEARIKEEQQRLRESDTDDPVKFETSSQNAV